MRSRAKSSGRVVNESSLLVVDADGSNQNVLLVNSAFSFPDLRQVTHPSWSPDGTQIVFAQASAIVSISVDGSGEIEVARPGRQPAWSPDGHDIAYVSGDDIWLVRPDGSNKRNLTNTPSLKEAWPAWSFDSNRMAYVVGELGLNKVLVLDLATGTTTDLTTGGSLEGLRLNWLDWARASDKLALGAGPFASQANPDPDRDIWVIDLGNTANPVNLTNTPGEQEFSPSWSPDDTLLAYSSNWSSIHTMDALDGTGKTLIAAPQVDKKWTYAGLSQPDWKR